MKRLRIAVLISGNGSNLQALIDQCKPKEFPAAIVRVISNKADAYGLIRAKEAGILTSVIDHKNYPTREAFDEALHQQLAMDEVELVCLAGFMRLLSEKFVTRWHNRLINIHPSLLPSFKGVDAPKQALESGVKITGCTVHFVRPEMDSGPIIIQAAVPVFQGDTVEKLSERIHPAEHACYPLAVRLIASGRLTIDKNDRITIQGRIPEEPYVLSSGYMNPA